MFIRKFLSASKVDDVNAQGRFIKVMNCESVIRLRATYQGNLVLDSDAKAGFDVQTNQPFDQIQITSETEQKLELWVSEHKLSYDALSTKPNSSNSYLVEHFGLSQVLMPYDPAQSGLLIVGNDSDYFVGGEGVTKQNGIPVKAGDRYEHKSAAPLHVYIEAQPTYKIQAQTRHELPVGTSSEDRPYWESTEWGVVGDSIYVAQSRGCYFINIITGSSELIDYQQGGFVTAPIDCGGVYCGLVAVGASKARIRSFDPQTLRYGGYDITYTLETSFRADQLAYVDGVFYLFGQTNDDAKIYKINKSGDIVKVEMPDLNGVYWRHVVYDESESSFYVLGTDDLVKLSKDLTQVDIVVTGLGVTKRIQLFENHIAINEKGGWKLFNRNTFEKIPLPDTAHGIHASGKVITVLGDAGLFQSEDNGVVYANEDTSFNSPTAHISQFTQIGGLFYFHSHTNVYRFEADVDKSEAKATFRVFKESF